MNNNSWLYYLSLIVFTILNLAMLVNYPNILKIVTNVGDNYYIPVMPYTCYGYFNTSPTSRLFNFLIRMAPSSNMCVLLGTLRKPVFRPCVHVVTPTIRIQVSRNPAMGLSRIGTFWSPDWTHCQLNRGSNINRYVVYWISHGVI